MANTKRMLRTASFAIAILGIAFVGAPAATAVCVGHKPIWWADEDCSASGVLVPEDWFVCVSNDPVRDCL
jgi:hypothetical protein